MARVILALVLCGLVAAISAKSLYEELLEMKFGVKRQEDPCAGPCGEICAEDPPACDQCKTDSQCETSNTVVAATAAPACACDELCQPPNQKSTSCKTCRSGCPTKRNDQQKRLVRILEELISLE